MTPILIDVLPSILAKRRKSGGKHGNRNRAPGALSPGGIYVTVCFNVPFGNDKRVLFVVRWHAAGNRKQCRPAVDEKSSRFVMLCWSSELGGGAHVDREVSDTVHSKS